MSWTWLPFTFQIYLNMQLTIDLKCSLPLQSWLDLCFGVRCMCTSSPKDYYFNCLYHGSLQFPQLCFL